MRLSVVLSGLSVMGILVPLACGGETDSGGSGGGGVSAGGSGGATTGGTGGTSGMGSAPSGGGGAPGGGAGGAGGAAGCPGDMPDCVVCSQLVGGICENGAWHCPDPSCPDAGCPSSAVPTADGCLSCAEVSTKLSTGIEAARAANASCGSETDCVLTSASTACAGACQIAVSKSGEAAFQAALVKLDGDYCKSFVDKCGYSTPKCAVPTLVCNSGKCEAKLN